MDETYDQGRAASRAFPLSRRGFIGASAALALGGATGVLSGCSDEASGALTGPRRIHLSFLAIRPPTSLSFAPELLADAAGYFNDEGLEVKVIATRGSPPAIQLVLAGRAALTRITQIEGMKAAAGRGAPLVNVGMVFKRSTIRFVSSARAPLREPSDFIGRTVGVPARGGSSELELDLLLAAAGVDPRQVRRQVVGLTPGVFSLVEQERLGGYAVSIDTARLLERQAKVAILDPSDFMHSGGQFYMASAAGLARNREALGKYIRAVRAALEFMLNDEGFDRTLALMRRKYSFDALNDTPVARASLAEYRKAWTAGGPDSLLWTPPQRWRAGYAELVEAGLVPAGAPAERWFTNEFLDQG